MRHLEATARHEWVLTVTTGEYLELFAVERVHVIVVRVVSRVEPGRVVRERRETHEIRVLPELREKIPRMANQRRMVKQVSHQVQNAVIWRVLG